MKKKLSIGLIAILLGTGGFVLNTTTQAYPVNYYHCKIVPAHWANGYKYPPRKVCWGNHPYCRYVPGHWQNGYYHEGHYVCARRYY